MAWQFGVKSMWVQVPPRTLLEKLCTKVLVNARKWTSVFRPVIGHILLRLG